MFGPEFKGKLKQLLLFEQEPTAQQHYSLYQLPPPHKHPSVSLCPSVYIVNVWSHQEDFGRKKLPKVY